MVPGHVFKIIVKKKCLKKIGNAPEKIQDAVDDALKEIAVNPYFNPNIKKLKGDLEGSYRYRIGDYRLIYDVYEQEIVVVAIDFGPRGDVYK